MLQPPLESSLTTRHHRFCENEVWCAKYDGQIHDGRTTVDLVFTSPSTASTYMASSNRSGNATWHTSEGTLLGDLA